MATVSPQSQCKATLGTLAYTPPQPRSNCAFDQVTNTQLGCSGHEDQDVQSSSDGHKAEEQPVVAWAAKTGCLNSLGCSRLWCTVDSTYLRKPGDKCKT